MTERPDEILEAIRRGEHDLQPCLRDSKRLIYPASCDECRAGGKCLAQLQPTDTQADLTERARAIADASIDARVCCDKYPGCVTVAWRAALAKEIAAFAQSEREAAARRGEYKARPIVEAACRYCLLNGTKKTQAHKDLVDAVQALFDRRRLASPAPQDDLEDDVKHGNAEYFRAALAHATAEARRAALEECAQLADPLRSRGLPEDVRRLSEAIRALASPAPKEETR